MTPQFASASRATFQNELRLLLRDSFCVALLVCFSLGLACASWKSNSLWRGFSIQQAELQAAAREAWLSQPTDNAHMATHYGQTVYKSISPLAGFDPGAISDFGSTLFLQSHRQSTATHTPLRDEISLDQNEAYSPAVLLAIIGPLLIIILGSASIAREKEGGTLSILLTTGASWPAIIAGKSIAILLTLFIVATPGLLLFAIPWFERHPFMHPSELIARETVILVMMAAYYIGWLGLTMLVASKANSSMSSFSVLIALWSVVVLVIPRVAGDVATFVSPLPTQAEIRLEKENAVHEANQSSIEIAKANKALEAKLLEEFQVDRIEDLPIDMAGAQMIDQETITNRIYDEIDERVTQATHRQNSVMDGFQLASPFLAMRAISTSLSATDRGHHIDFVNAAENYRRQFVKELNLAEMQNQTPGNSAEERRDFWAQISAFLPNFVSSLEAVKRSKIAVICIFVWALAMGIAAFLAPPQISRVQ